VCIERKDQGVQADIQLMGGLGGSAFEVDELQEKPLCPTFPVPESGVTVNGLLSMLPEMPEPDSGDTSVCTEGLCSRKSRTASLLEDIGSKVSSCKAEYMTQRMRNLARDSKG